MVCSCSFSEFHCLNGMDVRHEETRHDKNQRTDNQRADIEQQQCCQAEFDRRFADVVSLRVERYYSCVFLYEAYANANDIADDESFASYERAEPEECVADGLVACAKSLERAYHRYALKYHDEQSANHRY